MGNLGWKREKKDRCDNDGEVSQVCPSCNGNGGSEFMDIDTGDVTWTYCDRCGGSGWIGVNSTTCGNSDDVDVEFDMAVNDCMKMLKRLKEIRNRLQQEKEKK